MFEYDLAEARISWILSREELVSITKKVFSIWKDTDNTSIKRKCGEITGVLIYRGEIEMLEDICKQSNQDIDFYIFMVNELNNVHHKIPPLNSHKISKRLGFESIENLMTKHV